MVYLTILVAGLGLGLAPTPLVVGVPILVGVVDTPVEAAICVPLGLLVGLASLHVISAVARLSGRVAGAFLDGGA